VECGEKGLTLDPWPQWGKNAREGRGARRAPSPARKKGKEEIGRGEPRSFFDGRKKEKKSGGEERGMGGAPPATSTI